MLEHDAERHAVVAFDLVARKLDEEFTLAPGLRHDVLTRLGFS